ncbi:MAG: hypothetical protein ACR5K4_00755 [Sodalis sp. (in: enterobacteria)]
MKGFIVAILVSIVVGKAVCDLKYIKDSAAKTDINLVIMEDCFIITGIRYRRRRTFQLAGAD